MKLLPTGRIKNSLRAVQARLGANAVIFIYHRVTCGHPDPQRLAVSPENFSSHMEILKARTCPVKLEELPERLKTRKRHERPLSAVTFDDGYLDNLEQAAPILAARGVPATIFVTTSMIDHPHEFWWDDLSRMLFRPGLPETLELRIREEPCSWVFSHDTPPLEEWNVWMNSRRTEHIAYKEIARRIRNLPPPERDAVMEQLHQWSGVEKEPRPENRTMTGAELLRLAGDRNISIGAHTVHHPALAAQPADAQAFEITESRIQLEQMLGRAVTTFAYPFGREKDVSRETVRLTRNAGFSCACTTAPRPATRWTDPLRLPRFSIGDWNGEKFKAELELFLRTGGS